MGEVWDRRPDALIMKTGMLILDAVKSHIIDKVGTVSLWCKHRSSDHARRYDHIVTGSWGGIKQNIHRLSMLLVWGMDPIWKSALTATGNIRRQSQALLGQWIKTAVNGIHCQCFKLLEMKVLTVSVNSVTCL